MALDAAAREYTEALTARLRDALGDALLAVSLVGSAGGLGGYTPGRSDLDVLVVVREPLGDERREAIVACCRHEALACPARKLELVVYTREQLAHPAPSPRWELNLNTGADEPLHAGADPGAEPSFWFLLDLAQARLHATALHGPPASEFIGEVPRDAVVHAQAEAITWYAHNEPGEGALLAAARAWRFVEEGDFASKQDAWAWAVERRRRGRGPQRS